MNIILNNNPASCIELDAGKKADPELQRDVSLENTENNVGKRQGVKIMRRQAYDQHTDQNFPS